MPRAGGGHSDRGIVEAATWSKAGQLDWWVKERQQCSAGYGVQTADNGGSELLIFVRRRASDHATNDACSRD